MFEDQDFRAKVTRVEFEEMIKDLLERVPGPVEEALLSAHMRMVSLYTLVVRINFVFHSRPSAL